MNIGGIFGPKLSGKTTLAKHIVASYWRNYRIRALVLDINGEEWDKSAWVTCHEALFWKTVWAHKGYLVIVDESSSTIKRDKDLIPAFTRIRHCKHKFVVIGHSGCDLLPVMRQSIDVLYLFRQSEPAAKIWVLTMAEKQLFLATQLSRYEFLTHEMYGPTKKMKLTI